MASTFDFLKGSGAPPARLDNARFTTFFDLDVSELLVSAVLWFLLPLISFGLALPELVKWVTAASWPALSILLFFVKHEDHHVAYWIGRMIPFWARQREFRLMRRSAGRVSPASELADRLVEGGENALSFAWRRGADGEPELHIYESPLAPYRALVRSGGAAERGAEPQLPAVR
jgi:hypothetical protein